MIELILLSFVANAQVTFSNPQADFESVKIFSNAKTKDSELKLVCKSLRWKPVFVAKPKVYVGQVFGSDTEAFKKSPLESINAGQKIYLQLSFLRNVEGEKIKASFVEGLETNKVDVKSPEIAGFLQNFLRLKEIKEGSSMSFYFSQTATQDSVEFWADGVVAQASLGPKGFAGKILSIWFGEASDRGLEDFKNKCLAK